MKSAVSDAMLQTSEVTYVNAHATSTPLGDAAEISAISRLFRKNLSPINVSSVKGTFGMCSLSRYILSCLYELINQ